MKEKFSSLIGSGMFFMMMVSNHPATCSQASDQKINGMKMQSQISGSGSPVVLVPGGLTGWISWEPHAKILSTEHKVIRVQLLNVQFGLENRQLPSDYSG